MKDDFSRGLQLGIAKGRIEALEEFQTNNPLKDLPNDETLFKIFKLLFECRKRDQSINSVYMNPYSRYAEYIRQHWND